MNASRAILFSDWAVLPLLARMERSAIMFSRFKAEEKETENKSEEGDKSEEKVTEN